MIVDIDVRPEIAKYICNICSANLNSFYYFKQTCLKNNTTMNNYLKNIIIATDSHKQISSQTLDNTNPEVASNSKILLVTTQPSTAKQKEKQVDKEEPVLNLSEFDIVIKKEPVEIQNAYSLQENDVMDIDIKEESPLEDHTQVYNKILNNLKDDNNRSVPKKKSINNYNSIKKQRLRFDIKNYHCLICKQNFKDISNLLTHKKIHVGNTNFECSICKKIFIEKSHLTLHEKIHAKYQCSICKKTFGQKVNWLSHLKIHTDNKDYQCKFCQKKFIRKEYYEQHLVYHHQNL